MTTIAAKPAPMLTSGSSTMAVARRGGEVFMRKRLKGAHVDRAMRLYQRFGILAVVVPALLPPPIPFKVFVVLAGAVLNTWREFKIPAFTPVLWNLSSIFFSVFMVQYFDVPIYAMAVEAMALGAEDIVFVDDLPGNLKPARALGMATVRHERAPETVAELERLLGVTLRAPTG